MFEAPLPPLLRTPLDASSEAWMRDLPLGPWEPIWQLGDRGPHAQVRAYAAGKLMLFDGDRPTGVNIPVVAYVLRAGDVNMAIDSGLSDRFRDPPADEPVEDGPAPGMRYRPVLDGPSFAEQLAAEGVRLDRAVCTHLHKDHAGGVRALGLPVEVTAEELAAALDDQAAGYPAEELAGVEFAPVTFDRGPVGPWERHAELAPGVLAISTPGHTPGSMSIFACLGGAWAMVCGDAVYPRSEEPDSPAFHGMLRIRRAREEIGGMLLAGHDTAVLRACAGGAWLGS